MPFRTDPLSKCLATRYVALGLLASSLMGCASNQLTRSEFLSEPSRLATSADPGLAVFRSPELNTRLWALTAVEIAPPDTQAPRLQTLGEAQRAELTAHLQLTAQEVFVNKATAAPLTTPAVLRVKLTDVDTANVAVNWATTLLIGPVTTGGASIEVEILAASDRQLLFGGSCVERGNVVSDFRASYSTLGHAKASITRCMVKMKQAYEGTIPAAK